MVGLPEDGSLRSRGIRREAGDMLGAAFVVGPGRERFPGEHEGALHRGFVLGRSRGERAQDEGETTGGELREEALALRERRGLAQDLERAGQLAVELDRRAERELESRRRHVLSDLDARAGELGGERGRGRVNRVSGQTGAVAVDQPDDRRLGGADLHRHGRERLERVTGRAEIR